MELDDVECAWLSGMIDILDWIDGGAATEGDDGAELLSSMAFCCCWSKRFFAGSLLNSLAAVSELIDKLSIHLVNALRYSPSCSDNIKDGSIVK